MTRVILHVDAIHVFINRSHILRDISLQIEAGESVFLIGRNGAGKTTTLLSVLGFRTPKAGNLRFQSESLLGQTPHVIARKGIGYAPEDSRVFPDLTVHENIAYSTYTRQTRRSADERICRAYEIFPKLERYRDRKGTQLSGGERKMLSVARALALDPVLLLLDEPFEGLSPAIMPEIAESLREISRMGVAILTAESNIYHVPDFADRLYVIERGEIRFGGSPEDIRHHPEIMQVVSGTT
ncbi:High-affinity branched-chain amino acid transport ATP-binding protein LivF [Candidatus Entotheonellaceae bacterium PAL068K]